MTAKVIDITIRHHNDHGTARSANSDEFSDDYPRLFEVFQGVGTKDNVKRSIGVRKLQNRMLDEFSVRQARLCSGYGLFGKVTPIRDDGRTSAFQRHKEIADSTSHIDDTTCAADQRGSHIDDFLYELGPNAIAFGAKFGKDMVITPQLVIAAGRIVFGEPSHSILGALLLARQQTEPVSVLSNHQKLASRSVHMAPFGNIVVQSLLDRVVLRQIDRSDSRSVGDTVRKPAGDNEHLPQPRFHPLQDLFDTASTVYLFR